MERQLVKIELTEIVRNENSTVPQLKLKETYSDNTILYSYLTPFRGYRFQLSRTIDGEYDLSSNRVLGLANIIRAFETYSGPQSEYSIWSSNVSYTDDKGSVAQEVFASMIKLVIYQYASNYLETPLQFSYEDDDLIYKFAEESYNYVKSLM